MFEREGELTVLVEWLERYALERAEDAPDTWRFPDRGLYPGESIRFVRGADGEVAAADLSGIRFARRPGPGAGTFRIEPLAPIDELRAVAEAAEPPVEEGDFPAADLVRLTDLDPQIRLDVRYAGDNNFMGTAFYSVSEAFLERPAAEAVARVNRALAEHGLALLIHDGYRAVAGDPDVLRRNPGAFPGFRGQSGGAARFTTEASPWISEWRTARPANRWTSFPATTNSPSGPYPGYVGGTSRQRWRRELLRREMERAGFTVNEIEWWHFDYDAGRPYPIRNVPLREIAGGGSAR